MCSTCMTTIMPFEFFYSLKKILCLINDFLGGEFSHFLNGKTWFWDIQMILWKLCSPWMKMFNDIACILNWTQLIEMNSKLNYELLHITNDNQLTLEKMYWLCES
jgi:hypothetical protein